ncbi:chitin synthesis regulation, resistance to congo red-domain-containing protein [Bisporella sp. PMI_857]|nr:chitin synthesis regulation, resistance to congo red-domain-containing protein [Bisporella sp. PMI_857]
MASASVVASSPIEKRCCTDVYGITYKCDYSSWDSWGRWVALAVIVVTVLLVAFLFSCINARRRRRRGLQPMYGTGWIPAGGQYKYGQNNNNYYQNQPAPPYAPPYNGPIGQQQTGNTFNSNDGYYGNHGGYAGQQHGVELQPPQNAYHAPRGGENVYEAPQGPPPSKNDGAVR